MGAPFATLEHVTVYRDGAVCLRRVSLPASAEREVRLGGLPMALEPASLRAWVREGPASLRILEVRPAFDAQTRPEEEVAIEMRDLEAAQHALEALHARRKRLEDELAELRGLNPSFREPEEDEPPRPASVDAVLALAKFVDGELEHLLAERRRLAQEVVDAEEAVALRQRRLAEAGFGNRHQRTRLSRVAVLTLSEPPASPSELVLEYQVPGARWAPTYALQLDAGLTSGKLKMRASVAQKTGEDWGQVRLALSTAILDRRSTPPELRALVIGRKQDPPRPQGWREPPPGLDELFQSYDVFARQRGPTTPPLAPPPSSAPRQRAQAPAEVSEDDVMSESAAPAKKLEALVNRPEPVMAKSRARGMVSSLGSAQAKPAPSAAPPGAAPMDGFGGAASKDEDEEERPVAVPEPLGPDMGLLDYGQLRLVGADDGAGRGKLVASGSIRVEWTVHAVAEAQAQANRVAQLALPGGHPVRPVSAFDYRYDAASAVDVPSNGQWTTLPVMICDVAVSAQYVCVPSVEAKVYRTLAVANRSTHALLGGPVDVTAGDTFLLTSTLPPMAPGAAAEQALGLGVEEAIKVARRTQHRDNTAGFLGGGRLLAHEVEVELNNTLSTPANVEVRERLPVLASDEKEAKIEDARATPPWEEVSGPVDGHVVRGARRWKVVVPAGQKRVLKAEYGIRLSSGRALVGGNRRDG